MRSEKSQKLRAEYFDVHRPDHVVLFPDLERASEQAFTSVFFTNMNIPVKYGCQLLIIQRPRQASKSLLHHFHPSNPIRKAQLLRRIPVILPKQAVQHSSDKRVSGTNCTTELVVINREEESGLTRRLRSQVQNKPSCGLEWWIRFLERRRHLGPMCSRAESCRCQVRSCIFLEGVVRVVCQFGLLPETLFSRFVTISL